MLELGRGPYVESCQRYGVKPNREVLAQLDQPDLMRLQRIDASKTFLGNLGVHAVLDFVHNHQGITEVLLQKNGVDAACVEHFCKTLEEGHPSLEAVDLSDNPISTHTVRLLWETARRQRTLVKVRLDGCGVPDEWIERLQHALNSNAEFQQKGFYPYGPQRDLLTWRTVFILVLGDVEQVRRYAADVLQTIGSYVASMRVRVAPMTLKEGDSMEKVSAQVKRCSEANNHGLTWCTAFIGPNPLTTAQQNALAMVLAEKRPEVEPLRSKLGVLRDPVYRCARNVFVYALDDSKRAEESNVVPAKQWLHSAGFDGEAYRHLVADVGQDACALTPSVFSLRCQSDLIAALGTTFSEDPLRHSQLTLELRQQPENLDELTRTKREAALGALHVKKSAVLFNYLEDHSSAVSVPFILFGAGNLGKGEILSYAADFLRQRQMDGGTTVGDRTSLQAKVVHMSVDLKNRNVVVILYSILRVFAPTSSLEFPSIGALLSAVHQAIANYHGPPITLLISRLDAADTLGQDCNAAVDWLPNSFSGHIKIAISLNTESPILAYMRKRSPQPYVCLILPIGERHRLNLLRRCLSERGIHLSGMEECSIGDGGGEKTAKGADAAYLQKDESTTLLYPRLVAAYIQFVCIQPHGAPQTEADTCDLLERLPDTTSEVIAEMCASLESFHSPITLRYILLCLSFAALPVPELLYICEELGPCEKHSVLPALFQLAELDLVDWSAESMAQLSHETIRGTVSTMYAEHVDHVSVLVENHLYRLVVTRSPEMVNAMLYSLPLLVSNGNFVGASRLLLNTVVMHMILRRKDAAIYVIAAYFRLILAKEVLEELNTVGDMMDVQLDDEALQWAMMEVQRDSQNLFQTVLLKHNLSPFFRSAIEKLESPPLTVLHPTNRGSEDTSVSTWSLEGVCQFLHGRGEYVVASTPDTVSVFCSGSGECVAKISMPFENNQKILGALMATGTRVVVMSAEQLLLWDFVSKSFFFVSELTATPREDALDPFGTILIAVNRATSSLCILDIPRKRTIQDLPDIGASPAKSAQFCGSRVLLLAQCDMYLLDDEHTNPIKLQHDGPIRLVHCNADGRLIASSVGNLLYLWMATGDLVHRVATGSTPLSSLHFTANGSYLLTRQAEGVKVWKTITGTCLSVLPNEFDGEREIGTLRFTEDGSMMFANTGRHILLWDARTSKPVGALSAPAGLFAVVLELGNTIYAATTEGCIKSWSLAAPVPSITQVKAGSLTTNWLKNSKVSTSAITEVATNSTSTIFACLDAQHQLGLFSTQTGKRMQHRMGSARSAVVMGHETVLYIPSGELVIRQHNLVDGSETTRYLPSDTLDEAEVHLFRSEEDGYFGLTYFVHGSSCSLIYHMDEPSMLCRLVGHTGRTLHASFFGSLAYTVGEDCNIRLWNVARCAERATYTHPEPILMAKKDPLSGILTFLDGTGSIYRICVQNISSPTKACFVAVKADLVITSSYLMHHGPRCMAVYGNLAFFIMTDNTLVVANTDKDDVFSTVALTDTVSMELGVLHDQPTLITGHNTGDAISSRVISAEKAK